MEDQAAARWGGMLTACGFEPSKGPATTVGQEAATLEATPISTLWAVVTQASLSWEEEVDLETSCETFFEFFVETEAAREGRGGGGAVSSAESGGCVSNTVCPCPAEVDTVGVFSKGRATSTAAEGDLSSESAAE